MEQLDNFTSLGRVSKTLQYTPFRGSNLIGGGGGGGGEQVTGPHHLSHHCEMF